MQISGVTASGRKPSRLQLQVPTHEGGPVTLAEPPQVLINGEATPEIETLHRDSGVSFPDEEDEDHYDDEFDEAEDVEAFDYDDDRVGGGTFSDDDDDNHDVPEAGRREQGTTTTTTRTIIAEGKDPTTETMTPRTPEEVRKWKRKAKLLERKLRDKDEELRGVKRRVLEAVM